MQTIKEAKSLAFLVENKQVNSNMTLTTLKIL